MNFDNERGWLAGAGLGLLLSLALVRADESKPAPKPTASIPVAELKRDTPVEFQKEVLPFLKNNCLACHNTTKAKGGLNLETPQLILKGGDTGPAAVPGKGAESLVLKAAAHLDSELIMPPKDNKANAANLTPEQLALLKLWIDQGAKGEVQAVTLVNWLEKPPSLDPIFAVALTQDGQFAACGRGNRIDVYHVPSGRVVARLADAKLAAAGLTNAAHRDLVNALAFNPDGTLLASAGYREVKLWRRPRDTQKTLPALTPLTNSATFFAVSPDRKWLVTPVNDHSIALFDLASGLLTRTLFGHSNAVISLKFSPDSQRLLSGSADQTVRVWSVADGALVALAETPGAVHAVAWLGQGKQVASASADGVIRVWDWSGTNREPHLSKETDPSLIASAPTLTLMKELKGHSGPVTALDALPDGKQLLSGGADGTLREWNLDDGNMARELKHDGAVAAVAMCPDGKRFASAGTNNLARLWNANDGKLIAELKGDRYAYELVAETERALIVAKGEVEFRKKTLETAEAEHKKQTERVAKAAETNASTIKILAEKDKALKDAQTAKLNAENSLTNLLAEIKKSIESFENADKVAKESATKAKTAAARATEALVAAERATLSRGDAERIAADTASVAAKAKAAVTNADAARETVKRIAEESAAVAEKGKAFAEAVLADAETKTKLAAEAKVTAEKAIEEVASLAFAAGQLKPNYDKTLAEAPDKRKQATNQIESATKALAGADQEFKRAGTRNSVTAHELELAQQAAGRASNTLAGAKTTLEITEARQKQTDVDLDRFKKAAVEAEKPIRTLAFSPDGLTLATAGDDGQVHTWSADNGAAYEVFPQSKAGALSALSKKASSEGGTNGNQSGGATLAVTGGMTATPCFLDANTLLVATGSHRFVAWDLNPAWTLESVIGTGDVDSPLSDRVNAARFSPDGRTLATGSGEPTRSGEIKLWNVADGKFLREFSNVHSDAVLALDFSPDGKHLASSSADRFARVVDLATGKVVKAFEGHTSYVLGVAWKRDSRTLASAGADNIIKIWDFVTGERKKNIEGAGKEVTSIAFVGVTDQALATSGDNQVRIVRENGEKVRSLEGATDFMNSAAATPDGRLVVAGGQDGVLRVWNGAEGKLAASFGPAPGK